MPHALLHLILYAFLTADELPVPPVPPLPTPQLASLPDGDSDFIFQLRGHGLFDLARQVCLRKQQATLNTAAKLRWEILFADCCEDEAWLLPTARRHEVIALAATRISELLNQVTPLPETELALRLRQLELFVAAATIESTALTLRSHLPDQKQLRFALDACSSGRSLANQLLQFTDELRSTLPPQTLRDVRFRLRSAELELRLTHQLLSAPELRSSKPASTEPASTEPASTDSLRQIQLDAENLIKGLPQQHLFHAHFILATTLLRQNDPASLELQLRNLATFAASPSDRRNLEALHHLRLLKMRQPSQLLAREIPPEFVNDPELQTLQLHALLQLCELHSEIELNRSAPANTTPPATTDSGKSSPLAAATQNFHKQLEQLKPTVKGVWAERLSYAEQRLPVVLLAGPTAADTLESAAILINAGNDSAALDNLRQITRIPAASHSLKALAQLQIGEILVRQTRWTQALPELEAAANAFAAAGNTAQHSAADLLRLFTLAQLHREAPDSSPAAASAAALTYKSALDQHLRLFPSLPTAEFAREYRARFLQHTLPLEAAADLLDIPTPQPGSTPEIAQRHLRKLALLGSLLRQYQLLHALHSTPVANRNPSPNPGTNPSTDPNPSPGIDAPLPQRQNLPEPQFIRSELAAGIRVAITANHSQFTAELATLQLQLLTTAQLCADASTPSEELDSSILGPTEWSQLLADLAPHISSLRSFAATGDAFDFPNVVSQTMADATTLQLLAASRSLLSSDTIQTLQQQLLALPQSTRREQLLLLLPHLKNPALPGNTALIAFATQLLPNPQQPGRSAASLLADLPLTLRLAHTPETAQLPATLLNELARQPLTTSQIQTAAAALAANSISIPAADFWKHIQRRTNPGEPEWLEAAFQLASIAASQDRTSEALRILRTVSVLHPAWGSPERKQRAATLLQSLDKKP